MSADSKKPDFASALLGSAKGKGADDGGLPSDDEAAEADDLDMDVAAYDELKTAFKSGDDEAGLAALKSIITSCMAYGHGEEGT